jgi:hypothetical protein
MAIVASYDWESDTFTNHMDDMAADQAWRDAVEQIGAKARQTLPECASRVERAVWMVLSGDVELLPGGNARVRSQSNGTTKYYLVNGECSCKDYAKAPSHWCKHRIAYGIARRAATLAERKLAENNGQVESQAEASATTADEETITLDLDSHVLSVPMQYVVMIQGKPFVRYCGLLQMAQERGLVSLTAEWTYNDAELSLAHAVAIFADGRRFEESGDASPSNTNRKVAVHFRRVALTRAKARVLRDALGVDLVAVEELSDSE